MVPENEQLFITKVDEYEGTSTFSYRSDPASDIIFPFERKQINNFVAVHQQRFWLTSVLWLLSELAIEQFGKGRFLTSLEATRLMKKLCVNMENKQWTRGEDLREFVFNGSYKM